MTDTLPTSSTGTQVGQDAITAVEQNFPQLAWMLAIPELASVIVNQILTPGITDQNQIQSIIENTQWWQTTSPSARAFLQQEIQDPAASQQAFYQQQSALAATFSQLGLNPSALQLNTYTYASLLNGWSTEQTVTNIASAVTVNADGSFTVNPNAHPLGAFSSLADVQPALASALTEGPNVPNTPGSGASNGAGGQLLYGEQQLQQLAKQYMVNVSPQTLGQWALQIASGHSTQEGYQAYLQSTAQGQFPWMAQGIQEGQTPLQIVNPYANMVANELGTSPNEIDWTQPKWSQLLSTTDPKTGSLVQKPLWQATNELRSNPAYGWQYTNGARDSVYSFVQGLQQTMGFRNYSGASVNPAGSYGSSGG